MYVRGDSPRAPGRTAPPPIPHNPRGQLGPPPSPSFGSRIASSLHYATASVAAAPRSTANRVSRFSPSSAYSSAHVARAIPPVPALRSYFGPGGGLKAGAVPGGGLGVPSQKEMALKSVLSHLDTHAWDLKTLGTYMKLSKGGMMTVAGGGKDLNPLSKGWQVGRTDMGVDAHATPGAPIIAPNDSKVVGYNANWYAGQPYMLMQLTAGPNKGKYWYAAEQIAGPHSSSSALGDSLPAPGTTFKRGEPVAKFATSGTGIEIGYGSPTPGQTLAAAQGNTGDGSHNNAPAGVQFVHDFIQGGAANAGPPARRLSSKQAAMLASRPQVVKALDRVPVGKQIFVGGGKVAPMPGGGGGGGGGAPLQGVPSHLGQLFIEAGKKYHIDPAILAGVAQVETAMGTNRSVSSAGAQGLMQFMPGTARGLGVDPYNDRSAVMGAAKLLNQYGFQSDPTRAIGAYNGGPGNPQMGYANAVLSAANGFRGHVGSLGGAPQMGGGGGVPSSGGGGGAPSSSGGGGGSAAQMVQAMANGNFGSGSGSGTAAGGAMSQADMTKQTILASLLAGLSGGGKSAWDIGPNVDIGSTPNLGSLFLANAQNGLQALAGPVKLDTHPALSGGKRKRR